MSNQANMKIVCSTERAFDHTTAVLDFIGSGEYAVDKESKVIKLNVSCWDWCRLIDIIHFQFTEELGERAWRKEIDFFQIDGNDKAEKFEKSPKPEKPQKRMVHLIVGELASKRAGDIDDLIGVLSSYGEGAYYIREFDSEVEERAYFQALEDLNGWNDYTTLEEHYDDSEIEEFDKRYEEMLSKENQEQASPEESTEKDCLKYLDCELYQVETDTEGKKQIHIDGYCYWNGETYQCVQASGCYISVEKMCSDIEKVHDAFEKSKQYQGEIAEDGIAEYYKEATELRMEFVSEDTPDGRYVHY